MGALQSLMSWWAVYYADHQMASLIVRYLHLAGLVVGAGTAVAMDRQVLYAAWRPGAATCGSSIEAVRRSHAVVVPALGVVVGTGLLMTLADLPTFQASPLFWIKMASVAVLLVNGALLLSAERACAARGAAAGWPRLVMASGASLVLWFFILWMGAWLTVAA